MTTRTLRRAVTLLTNTSGFDQGASRGWHAERVAVVKELDALLAAEARSETPAPSGSVEEVKTAHLKAMRAFAGACEQRARMPFFWYLDNTDEREEAEQEACETLDAVIAAAEAKGRQEQEAAMEAERKEYRDAAIRGQALHEAEIEQLKKATLNGMTIHQAATIMAFNKEEAEQQFKRAEQAEALVAQQATEIKRLRAALAASQAPPEK